MATQITKELAKKIAKKLKAEKAATGRAHDLMVVKHNGVVVTSFNIRHGSRKNLGHDHIPDDLKVGPHFTKELGQCSKDRKDWIEKLKQRHII